MDEQTIIDGRDRLVQVFRYLEALHDRRNPPVKQVSGYQFSLRLRDMPASELTSVLGDGYLLKVKRPNLTPCPDLPASLRKWIRPGWDNPTNPPSHLDRIETGDNQTVEMFAQDGQRLRDWSTWTVQWNAWAPGAKIERAIERIYQNLYEQHSILERDGERYELVLGDGILTWDLPEGKVNHPLLLQPVELVFNAPEAEFSVIESARPLEFYTAALRSRDVDAAVLALAREQIDASDNIHPAEDLLTEAFLKGLATSLHAQGDYHDSPPSDTSTAPGIYRDRVIFRRNKTAGFGQAIRQVIDELTTESGTESPTWLTSPPEGLLRFVGIDTRAETPSNDAEGTASPEDDEDIYFTKPANHEQFKIVRKLNSAGCVLVQGPPGTGKTHTIANLIGHLLANGKSVLVTSHTTKALTVVTDKVARPLQPLCVSVLESDRANRDRLEAAVQSIADGLTSDAGHLPRRAQELSNIRADLLVQIRDLRSRLRAARNAEFEPVAYRGQAIRPIEAAREIARERDKHGWIPGSIADSDHLPLTLGEFRELYESNRIVSADDETNFPDEVPDLAAFPPPDEFETVVSATRELRVRDLDIPNSLVLVSLSDDEQVIAQACEAVEQALLFLAGSQSEWKRRIVDLARRGEAEMWLSLVRSADDVARFAMNVEERLYRVAPQWNGTIDPREACATCRAIEEFLANGKRLSRPTLMLRPAWQKTVRSVTTADGPAVTKEHFQAAREALELRQRRGEFSRLWNGRMSEICGPIVSQDNERPERFAIPYAADVAASIQWYRDSWPQIEKQVESAGMSIGSALLTVPASSASSAEIDRLVHALSNVVVPMLRRLVDRAVLFRYERRLSELKSQAQNVADRFPSIPLIQSLKQSICEEDTNDYRTVYHDLRSIYGRADSIVRRRDLLRRLSESAPQWAQSIRFRTDVHGGWEVPGDVEAAWRWKRIDHTLEARSRVSIQAIVSELSERRNECERITTKLVECLSWGSLVRRTSMAMRMALAGYVQILRRIGKGTGVRVPRLVLEAQRLMAECQQAVPVWVMPLSRVVESFDAGRAKFDVVIIDEASQMDLNGLLAMFMAKQVVIVGDDKQVEPLDVGTKLEAVQSLIDEHLRGIPRWQLWDGKQSVYSLADGPFEPIRLREHFRCVPDIIRFSNRLSYNGSILPLREDADIPTRPFVVPFYVAGASVDHRRVNRAEALTLVALMKAVTEQPEYAAKTVGVIQMVGEDDSDQRRLIVSLAQKHIGDVELANRQFRCGNSAQFQGDERDIMFLSLVEAPNDGVLRMRSEELYKKRYNVAASRAKDQMWVLYSLDPSTDLQPGDLRRELIEFALDPNASERVFADKSVSAESDFELRMLRRLVASGFGFVEPQYKVGAYRVDFAVRRPGLRIAIECDGDQFHGADKLDEDMARQATLERLGWRFIRVRGSEFYRDEESAFERVVKELREHGVEPSGENPAAPSGDALESNDLLERVKERAAELLDLWSSSAGERNTGAPSSSSESAAPIDSATRNRSVNTHSPTTNPISRAPRIQPSGSLFEDSETAHPILQEANTTPRLERSLYIDHSDSRIDWRSAYSRDSLKASEDAILHVLGECENISREDLLNRCCTMLTGSPDGRSVRSDLNKAILRLHNQRKLRVSNGWYWVHAR